jgi:hypothetical protein
VTTRAMLVLLVAACASCGGGNDVVTMPAAGGSDDDNPYVGYTSANYAGAQHWLCHPSIPGPSNACNGVQDTTIVQADGSSVIEPFLPASDPPVDCFYVYPTTSPDPGPNSDFNPDQQEIRTTLIQAGRYGSVCRLFAPIYRQRTLTLLALDSAVDPAVSEEQYAAAGEMAYADVVDAFKQYIANENHGRGFLLLGHSQGARWSSRLLAEEIEAHPYLARHLIAAHIPGVAVAVPPGADVGGTLKTTPACRSDTQTDCVIAFSTYRQGDPELAEARFGVTGDAATQALCVNPAALAGGPGELDPYFPVVLPPVFQALLKPRGTFGPYDSVVTNATVALATPFFAVPGQISGECVVDAAGTSYLEIRIAADPADPRADDYPGEFYGGTGWGLHLADVSLAQGDLVRLAQSQSAAWLARAQARR